MTKQTCSECKHLAPGKFIDPNPHHPKIHQVYGCALRDHRLGVHSHTGACLQFQSAEVLGHEDEWHH